jgi:hypothetical protein
LPQALSPAIPIDSPFSIENDTSSRACTNPFEVLYRVVKFSMEINAILTIRRG